MSNSIWLTAVGRVSRCRAMFLTLCYGLVWVAVGESLPLELSNRAVAQETPEAQVAILKEKLQQETQALKRHIAELIESGQSEAAEATEQELLEFQRMMERKIRQTRGGDESANKEAAQKKRGDTERRRAEAQQARAEAEQKRAEAEEKRAAHEREAAANSHRHEPDIDGHLRELPEQLMMAIQRRQPDLVVELSHQIARLLHEQQVPHESDHDRPASRDRRPPREQPRGDQPRHDRPQPEGNPNDGSQGHGPRPDGPRPDGPRPDGPEHHGPQHQGPGPEVAQELRMMMQELRGEMQQLRRELDELRRVRN
jgi:hypothetical protein